MNSLAQDPLPVVLETDGKVTHATKTEKEMWGWIAMNLPDDAVFWEEEEKIQ